MKPRMTTGLFLCLCLLGLAGCKSTATSTSDQPKADPSFQNDIQPIFDSNCAFSSCHNSATAQAGLDLSSGKSYSFLVNVPSTEVPSTLRAAPGNSAASYLVMKLENTQSVGSRMPFGGNPLSTTQIQNIKNWIDKGANNNVRAGRFQ